MNPKLCIIFWSNS